MVYSPIFYVRVCTPDCLSAHTHLQCLAVASCLRNSNWPKSSKRLSRKVTCVIPQTTCALPCAASHIEDTWTSSSGRIAALQCSANSHDRPAVQFSGCMLGHMAIPIRPKWKAWFLWELQVCLPFFQTWLKCLNRLAIVCFFLKLASIGASGSSLAWHGSCLTRLNICTCTWIEHVMLTTLTVTSGVPHVQGSVLRPLLCT